MRITFVLDTFGGGGKERRCLQVIQGLNREGVTDIQVVIVNNDVAYKELYATTALLVIIDRKNQGLTQLQTAERLYRSLKSFRPDIVQAWGIMSAGLVALVKPFLKFRFIASYVADVYRPSGLNGLINRYCNWACDQIVSNSKAGLAAYGTPVSKAVVIYNGFNESRFEKRIDKSAKKEELGIQTQFVVAMVASFWQTKDWGCYIHAAKRIVGQRQDITFLAVGQGPQWDYYNRQIEENERPLIRMLGRRDDVDELYQICDVTVLCSTHGEALSNSIMESMAWGVPVIASDGGGTPEIIENGGNGMLIEKQTPEIVGMQITDLLDHPEELARMSQAAAKTVHDGFLLQRMTADYLRLYKGLSVT